MTSMTQQQMAAWDAGTHELMIRQAKLRGVLEGLVSAAHRIAGDKQDGYGRNRAWRYTDADARLVAARVMTQDAVRVTQDLAITEERIGQLGEQIAEREQAWEDHGCWSRYFPCLNRDGHIHASLRDCATVHQDTDMGWAAEMSGLTPDQAIHGVEGQFKGLGETLCSVCFPDAPADWCRTRSEVTRAEHEAARASKNAARDAAKALKSLAEPFRTQDGDLVATVAAAKAVVRRPAETQAQLEWSRTDEAAARWSDPADGRAFTARLEQRLARETDDAEVAARLLAGREADLPGSGQAREESDRSFAAKLKSERRAYFG